MLKNGSPTKANWCTGIVLYILYLLLLSPFSLPQWSGLKCELYIDYIYFRINTEALSRGSHHVWFVVVLAG